MKSFIRTKNIKGQEYLYKVTPYFDPDTGKWRQKTKYLGKNVDGEPVKKNRGGKIGKIYEFGEYIPAYWAVRAHKIIESLLTSCSPDEAASVILLAINRIMNPCPPVSLQTWAEGTYLSHLIPGANFEADELLLLLQKISDRPVVEVFSRMFASTNNLSSKRVLFTLRLHDPAELMREKGCGLFSGEILEQQPVVRIQYDPDKRILAGFDLFQFQRTVLEDTIDQVTSGMVSDGLIVPHWEELSPSRMLSLMKSECSFVTRTNASFGPVSAHILTCGEQTDNPTDICYYHGNACHIRPFSFSYRRHTIQGYILHDIRKGQMDRIAIHKNLQNIREIIQDTHEFPGEFEELVNEATGAYRRFFIIEETDGFASVRINQKELDMVINQLGKSCILYQGDLTWEECFSLVDMQGSLEKQMISLISDFERDFTGFGLERIRKGIFFICYLSALIQRLIMNRLTTAKIPGITSFEVLTTELKQIHVIKSYRPSVFPQHLSRLQKSILSYYGGLPALKPK